MLELQNDRFLQQIVTAQTRKLSKIQRFSQNN